jgi:endonuclease YncB( thermonuclease family)
MISKSKYLFLIAALISISVVPAQGAIKIIKIYDGDTVTLADGMKIRLLQIDTPELAPGECYADKAKATLISLLSKSGTITLKSDPASALARRSSLSAGT